MNSIPTRRLIEDWLPVNEISIESIRERAGAVPNPRPAPVACLVGKKTFGSKQSGSSWKLIGFNRRPSQILRDHGNAPRFSP